MPVQKKTLRDFFFFFRLARRNKLKNTFFDAFFRNGEKTFDCEKVETIFDTIYENRKTMDNNNKEFMRNRALKKGGEQTKEKKKNCTMEGEKKRNRKLHTIKNLKNLSSLNICISII